MDVRVTIDMEGLREVKRLGADLPKVMARGIERVLIAAAGGVQHQARKKPVMRSGRLVGSWTPRVGSGDRETELKVNRTARGASGWVGPKRVKYSDIQAEGGTVRATNSKYLAIPLGPAKTKAGVARKSSPRDYPDLFFIPSEKGGGLLVKRMKRFKRVKRPGQTRGKGRKVYELKAFYLLKESVKVPRTNFIERGVKNEQRSYAPIMDDVVADEIKMRRMAN